MPRGEERRGLRGPPGVLNYCFVCIGTPPPRAPQFLFEPPSFCSTQPHTALQLSICQQPITCVTSLYVPLHTLILFETSSFYVCNCGICLASNSPLGQEARSPVRWLLCSLVKHDFCWLHSPLGLMEENRESRIRPTNTRLIFVKGEKVK